MPRGRWVRGTAAVLLAVGLGVTGTPATAAPPQIEREVVDDSFDDEFLTEECGVPVVTTVTGQIANRAFERPGTGVLNVFTINLTLTATSGDRTVRFKDVGADVLRVLPDGSLVLAVIGQVPFAFTGVLKLDPTTGEVLQEPQHSTADTTRICAALTR
ncbi:MAG TPA: hypothetical protein VK894_06160 [Jiangellales bacterium]|nr:hypothetical protein [Jiangellales bacterium]